MSVLADFYDYARTHNIKIIPFPMGDDIAAMVRNDKGYGVFINFSAIDDMKTLNGVVAHEQGHCATGALGHATSPFQDVAQNEERADRWYFKQYIPLQDIANAARRGIVEPWELSEFLGFPERDIRKALDYYINVMGERIQIGFDC